MLVEHTFVTTLDAPEALLRAGEFLTSRGFVPTEQRAFAVDGAWSSVAFRRGRAKASKARSISELPQEVRLQWDRGRLTVAASISSYHRSKIHGFSSELPAHSPKVRLHSELLIAIAQGLEHLLAGQQAPEDAGDAWTWVERRIEEDAQRRERSRGCLLMFAIVFAFVMITLMVFALTK